MASRVVGIDLGTTHSVLAWTDVRPQLRAAADHLGIAVIDW